VLPGTLEHIARLDAANVRELKGALNKLAAWQLAEGRTATAEEVQALFADRRPATPVAPVGIVLPPAFTTDAPAPLVPGEGDDLAEAAEPLPLPDPACQEAALDGGRAMQLARRAFEDVVAEPGRRYNPLFVHGPAGCGKSYFVQALGNALLARWPGKPLACLSGEAFVEGYVAALQAGTVDRWRATLRRAEVLILDDVQALAGKPRSQEELFHLFNAVHARGGQVVLTSDRPGRALGELADRLRSRFEGGLAIALPPRGTRDRIPAGMGDGRERPPVARWVVDREALQLGRLGVDGRVMEGYR
jgi:chromosomal replication initiation ATPase DnaA